MQNTKLQGGHLIRQILIRIFNAGICHLPPLGKAIKGDVRRTDCTFYCPPNPDLRTIPFFGAGPHFLDTDGGFCYNETDIDISSVKGETA